MARAFWVIVLLATFFSLQDCGAVRIPVDSVNVQTTDAGLRVCGSGSEVTACVEQ